MNSLLLACLWIVLVSQAIAMKNGMVTATRGRRRPMKDHANGYDLRGTIKDGLVGQEQRQRQRQADTCSLDIPTDEVEDQCTDIDTSGYRCVSNENDFKNALDKDAVVVICTETTIPITGTLLEFSTVERTVVCEEPFGCTLDGTGADADTFFLSMEASNFT